ncbi:cilia- and flagella-associated protein 46 [Amia ocellicauda]|uniref:cilia- and flagella-associated protein 46 n=1 Tax=Amia ocellicauda TaxID=2972642 RepID=UPI00346479F2
MDLRIRQFLSKAGSERDSEALKTAYELMKAGRAGRGTSFSPELYVICAEHALQSGHREISTDCLTMYLKEKPPSNQFLGRAYLCQGQLKAPQTAENLEELEKAVMYFLKAIEISKEQPRYHFLIFNATVLYWQMIRPFLRPGSRQFLIPSLTQVVSTLEEIGESDLSWRAQLMSELVECLLDAGKTKEAATFAKITSEFIESNVPHLYPKIFSLQVRHKLTELVKAAKKAKTNLILDVIFKMQRLKSQLETAEPIKDSAAQLKTILLLLTQSDLDRPTSPTQGSTSWPTEGAPQIPVMERVSLLLELAHLSLEMDSPHVAAESLLELKRAGVTDFGSLAAIECLSCELELKKQGGKIEEYSKSAVEAHLKMIRKLDQTLQNAMREGDVKAIQVVCASQWGLCLPLLQHNLRKKIRNQLLRVADALEETSSLLFQLRCQVHAEISIIEEDGDHIEAALDHVCKALRLDEKGIYRDRLQTALRLLQLRTALYETPERTEDRAALMIEQAKKANLNDDVRKKRALLVNAGIALAPDAFQVVLDGDNEAKVAKASGRNGQISQLCAKAQHHTVSVQKAEGHLKRLADQNDKERMRLWAALAKLARKQEIWDVCRAASRFCLLYDDGRWKASRIENDLKDEESTAEGNQTDGSLATESIKTRKQFHTPERDLMRLLAEIRFINAEATVLKLRSEGVQLNGKPSPREDRSKRPAGFVAKDPEKNPEWLIYRDWIQGLSVYATHNFLRAAELGAELHEAWIVCNTAVYVWNYNHHLIKAGGQRELVEAFQKLIDFLKQTGHSGETVLFVMLCNALAQGLTLPWIPGSAKSDDDKLQREKTPAADRGRKGAGRGVEKTGSRQSFVVDPSGMSDVKRALEVCEFALQLTNGSASADTVPVAVRKQVIATWVRIKQLLQQPKLDLDDESKSDTQSAMTRVLVGLEMHSCNNSRLMEFSAPSLSVLAKMTSDCNWTDAAVELETWLQLAHFARVSGDHELVMACSQRALQLETAAGRKVISSKQELYTSKSVQEMLSSVACIQGQSVMQRASGRPHTRQEALKAFELAVYFAEKAGNHSLCMSAARHFWNACSSLLPAASERQQLRRAVEKILNAIARTSCQEKTDGDKPIAEPNTFATSSVAISCGPLATSVGNPEEDLTLRAALYGLLFHIHADREDWESGLRVLDQAIGEMPRTKHRLLIFKHRVVVKARLGQSFLMDIQKFRDESEDYVSCLWKRVALCCKETVGQLACYQNAILSLQKPESAWQKVDCLLEFGQWLYCNQFPITDALHQIEWAIDILLHMKFEEKKTDDVKGRPKSRSKTKQSPEKVSSETVEEPKTPKTEEPAERDNLIPVQQQSEIGVTSASPSLSLADVKNVKQLEALFRAHTLMAAIADRASPQRQEHCLMAYHYVLRIWQVSLAAAGPVIKELLKNASGPAAPPTPVPTPKKERGRKSKEAALPPPGREKPKRKGTPDSFPGSPEEWAGYDCPEEVRQAFRQDAGLDSVNEQSITHPTRSLFFLDQLVTELQALSLTHLTLPALQLAEVIAHVVLGCKSLSDLYHLRIARNSSQLGLSVSAEYHEKAVGAVFVYEEEQIKCREAIVLRKEKEGAEMNRDTNSTTPGNNAAGASLSRKKTSGLCVHEMWIDKAEVLLDMGLYQPARLLLSEAHMAARGLCDKAAEARCLYLLAVLANYERNHSQATALFVKAQEIGGDERFWFCVTVGLVEATLRGGGADRETLACMILERAASVLRSACEERPNRAPVLQSLVASLEARRATLQIQALRRGHVGTTTDPEAVQRLMGSCDILRRSEEEFCQLGQGEQAVDAVVEQAKALRMLAEHTDDEDDKHHHLLEAYSSMLRAVTLQEEAIFGVVGLLHPQETSRLSLPAMRKLADLRLALVDLALDLLECVCEEEKTRASEEERKGSLQKAEEEFVRGTPDPASVQQEWITTGKTLGQVALTQLETVHGLHFVSVERRAKTLCLLGKCLRLLAAQADPLHHSAQWDAHCMEETNPAVKEGSDGTEEGQPRHRQRQFDTHQEKKYSTKAAKLQARRMVAQQFLAQASEALAQAIGLSLNHDFTAVLEEASLLMLKCLGQFEPASAGQFLALYQSCRCALAMGDVLRADNPDPSSSQLSALLNLQHNLRHASAAPSSRMRVVEETLTGISQAYVDTKINPQHLNILHEFPVNMKIIILQHSRDGSVLYGALIEKTKTAEMQKGKGIQQTGSLVCTKVARAAVDPEILSRLLTCARSRKPEMEDIVLEDGGDAPHRNAAPGGARSDIQDIVAGLDDYLRPIISQFDFSCVRLHTPPVSIAESGKAKDKDREEKPAADKGLPGAPADPGEGVFLLADAWLMEFPLEALRVLRDEGVSSVSRDPSLQLLHKRLQREEGGKDSALRRVK